MKTKRAITVTINTTTYSALVERSKQTKISKSELTNRALDLYLKTLANTLPQKLLINLCALSQLSPKRILDNYRLSTTAPEFWKLTLRPRTSMRIVKDLAGHTFATRRKNKQDRNIKDTRGYIYLPDTGNLIKDIEDGLENIAKVEEKVAKFIPTLTDYDNYAKEFLEKLTPQEK